MKALVFFILSAILGWALVLANAAQAKDYPKYEAGVGISLISLDVYPGSSDRYQAILPFPFFIYRSKYLQIDREAVRGKLLDNATWEIDFSMSGSLPVVSSRTKARAGMPDLPPILSVGPQIKYRLFGDLVSGKAQLILPVELAVSGDYQEREVATHGFVSLPHLRLQQQFRQSEVSYYDLQLTLGAFWGDDRYHDFFYGVDAANATQARKKFRARGGYGGARISLGGSVRYQRWWAGAFLRYLNLVDAAFVGSPLVEQNAAFSAGIAIAYVFQESKDLVSVRE